MKTHTVALSRTAKLGCIVLSAALCILGIVLTVVPEFPLLPLRLLCGGLLLVFGILKLIGFFSNDLYRLAFQYDLSFGTLLLAIGFVALVRPAAVLQFLCTAMGLYILGDGLFKIHLARDAKRFGISRWWIIPAVSILACGLGFALMLRPSETPSALTALLGINLAVYGILDLITVVLAVKVLPPKHPPEETE